MVNKLKKASIVFWVICGVSFVLTFWGCTQVLYNAPQFSSFLYVIYVIPDITLKPLFYTLMDHEKMRIVLCYLLLAFPVIFACFAIVLRMIAKAFEEQTITTIEISNQN